MSTPDPLPLPLDMPGVSPTLTATRQICCNVYVDSQGVVQQYVFGERDASGAWVKGPDGAPFLQSEGSKSAAAILLKDIIQRTTIAGTGN